MLTVGNLNNRDTLLGGRHQIIRDLYEQFFKKLTGHGATLAFFCDGAIQNDKVDTWITRQIIKQQQHCDMFDQINGDASLEDVVSNPSLNIRMTTFLPMICNIARHYGTLKTTHHHECDVEVVQFANANNALAIFSSDTDFLVFKGNWRLWCTKDLNVEDCLTKELSRTALTRYLELSQKQMALFATMAGNDFIQFDHIQGFLTSLGRYKERFLRLADFIRRMDVANDVANLSFILFQNSQPENTALIRKSIQFYESDFELCQPNKSNELLRRCENFKTIYICLAGLTTDIHLTFFDVREPGFMSYSDLVLPIYRRQYGVLLKHQRPAGGDKLTRKFRTLAANNRSMLEYDVEPDYPQCE